MFTFIKNFWSLLIYGYTLGKINLIAMLINIAILIYSILHFEDIWNENIWIFLFLVFANIIWQSKSMLEDIILLLQYPEYNFDNDYCCTEHIKLADDTKIIYDKEVKEDSCHVHVIYSSKVNQYLLKGTEIIISEIGKRNNSYKDYIDQNKEILLIFLKTKWHQDYRATFNNEKKLCMKSELTETSDGKCIIKVCRGNYYNSFVTNEIYCSRLSHNDKSNFLYPPLNPFLKEIHPLSIDSSFSDHIGVSTLVLTEDGFVIILKHNKRAAVHPNTFQATCSGSADYGDWLKLKKTNNISLQDFVKEVVARELFEETKIQRSNIKDVEIIGFFRDLIRGGKPDFCTITHLAISADKAHDIFDPDKKEANKTFVCEQVRGCNGFDYASFDKFVNDNVSYISPSLYMSYLFMKQWSLAEIVRV